MLGSEARTRGCGWHAKMTWVTGAVHCSQPPTRPHAETKYFYCAPPQSLGVCSLLSFQRFQNPPTGVETAARKERDPQVIGPCRLAPRFPIVSLGRRCRCTARTRPTFKLHVRLPNAPPEAGKTIGKCHDTKTGDAGVSNPYGVTNSSSTSSPPPPQPYGNPSDSTLDVPIAGGAEKRSPIDSSSSDTDPDPEVEPIRVDRVASRRSSKHIPDANHYGPTTETDPELELERSPSAATTIDFPEGGVQGWLVVLGSFCAMLSLYGLINSAAVFESYFSTNQLKDHSPSEIGWIFSLYLFIVFFVGVQVGPIFDRYGSRVIVAVGCLMIVLKYYQIILTYSVLGGLGGALLNCPAYGSIAHFFNVRRGFATGIASTAGGIGGVIFPIVLRELLPTIGFDWSSRVLALIMLGLAIPANLFIKTRLPPAKGDKVQSVWPDFSVFKDARFACAALGVFFMEWGLFVPLTYIVSYAVDHGQDATESYLLLSYLNAGSVLGRVLPGILADKIGRFNVIIITIAVCLITGLALWLPAGHSNSLLIAYAVLFGFGSGSNIGLVPVCLGQLCDHRKFGRLFSTAMMVASFGTLSSVPIGGALLSSSGWTAVILFSSISYAVALGFYTATRVLAVGGPSIFWRLDRILKNNDVKYLECCRRLLRQNLVGITKGTNVTQIAGQSLDRQCPASAKKNTDAIAKMTELSSAPVLSTPAEYLFERADPDSQTETKAPRKTDDELREIYEVARTARELRQAKWKTIALQFPDSMLVDAPRLVQALKDELNALPKEEESGPKTEEKIFILADTSYSACCVDEVAAEHADAQVVVHYGRSCLSPTSRLPVIYVFTQYQLDLDETIDAFKKEYPDMDSKVVIMADVTYQSHVPALASSLSSAGYTNLLSTTITHDPTNIIPNRKIVSPTPSEDTPIPESLKEHSLFHISTPPTALLLALSSRVSNLYIHNTPSSPFPSSSSLSARRLLGRRYAKLLSLSTAGIIGILVNTLSVSNYLSSVDALKKQIAAANKKSYTVVVGKLNPAKLANFAEIDGWVVVGCWESSLVEDDAGFFQPVVTPFELGVALQSDEERVWGGEWWGGIEGVKDPEEEKEGDEVGGNEEGEDGEEQQEEEGDDDSEEESAPPEFDLRTGKLVSTSRPMRVRKAKEGKQRNGEQDEETKQLEGSGNTSLTLRPKAELAMVNGVVSPGAEFLRSQRTWQGLGSDYTEEESTAIEEGRRGVARGYTVGESERR
ncbi:major facilitator superfamily domain-containing protein [Apiosordaria backusii]|uniref:2-(3-amino-3-carboxypropyl)histidine synthase subunit 2 n=1 Tax=Apiosordaria backusii TaxID=314023 RepID=A0AA40ASH8_9PEZI|nr:major facilitator superfamily domain-containing protein [Apiosordaria backusii]